jgi:hypothetical protein
MSQAARVDSIEKLKEFRVALCLFIDAVGTALNEAEAEIQRTTIWLSHDQNSYWKAQITRRREQFSQAKNALNAKKLTRTPLGGRYSVVDEEQAVAIAKQRLEEAERKLANVQRWARFFEDEILDYKGQTQSLARSTEAELPMAIAQLDRMITALDSYVALSAPEAQEVMAGVLFEGQEPAPDSAASVARPAVPTGQPSAAEYASLRKLTPSGEARAQVVASEPALTWQEFEPISQGHREAVAALVVERAAPAPAGKVILARSCSSRRRVYLERTAGGGPDDTGWYVGLPDGGEAGGLDAISIERLLTARPDWREVLQLPVGTLVVVNQGAIEVLLDADNRVIWPLERSGMP